MARHDYLPAGQAELRSWVRSFDQQVMAEPQRFGLMEGEAQSLHERIERFDLALDLAQGTTTRNVTTIEGKNLARAELLQILRPACMRIRDNGGVALEDKRALGLMPPSRNPRPIAAPTSVPVLEVASDVPMVHRLRFHDLSTPARRTRPDGAVGLQLYRVVTPFPVADAPIAPASSADLESAQFVGVVTRQPFRLAYTHADALRTVVYWARWQTARGLVGPWGPPAARVVA